jgi:hypothetical protein
MGTSGEDGHDHKIITCYPTFDDWGTPLHDSIRGSGTSLTKDKGLGGRW